MPGEPVQIGPFPGGLATRTDETSIQDDQLVESVNWVYGVDGTLYSRPPIWDSTNDPAGITGRVYLLGFGTLFTGSSSKDILFASNAAQGTFVLKDNVWSNISSIERKAFTCYGDQDNRAWFPANNASVGSGGWWKPADASITLVSTTPYGDCIISHKERLWISGDTVHRNRLYYSIPGPTGVTGDWDTGAGAGYIDVNPGDGQYITHIESYQDVIVIFKNDSTYMLSYDGNINRGQLVNVSTSVGSFNSKCVTMYRNNLFNYHDGYVYAFNGNSFQELNTATVLDANASYASSLIDPVVLSTFENNLVLRLYDKVYVYSFITNAWTTWESSVMTIGHIVMRPTQVGSEDGEYFLTSCTNADTNVYRINSYLDSHTESFNCSVRTKTFDFGQSYKFKRLFWWAVDASMSTNLGITGNASPISVSFAPTWDEVAANNWTYYSTNTWDALYDVRPDVVTGPITSSSSVAHRVYKFLKALRFRTIYFRVTLACDGTATNGPVRLFHITPMLASKETVVKQVS